MAKNRFNEKQVLKKLERLGFVKDGKILVSVSPNDEIKAGDFVMTYEIHKVKCRYNRLKDSYSVVDVIPPATYTKSKKSWIGVHERIMDYRSGQQGITKLLKLRGNKNGNIK